VGFPDLEGIGGRATAGGGRVRLAAEYYGSRVPGARPLVRAVRALGRELRVLGWKDARLGTYHLFTILRRETRGDEDGRKE
jgi:hypothetical protein